MRAKTPELLFIKFAVAVVIAPEPVTVIDPELFKLVIEEVVPPLITTAALEEFVSVPDPVKLVVTLRVQLLVYVPETAVFGIVIVEEPLIVFVAPLKVCVPVLVVAVYVPLFCRLPAKFIAATLVSFQVPPELIVTSPVNVFAPVFARVNVPETEVVPVTPRVKLVPVVKPVPEFIVKFPEIDKFAPVEVVPEVVLRLLKVVTTVDGKVLLEVMLTVPVLGVHVPAVVLELTTKELTFNVELAVIVTIPLLAPALPNIIDEAVSVDPETNVIVPFLLLFPVDPS